jgi:hypothetical protein
MSGMTTSSDGSLVRASRREAASGANELPRVYPNAAACGHSESARQMDHVAQSNQPVAVRNRDCGCGAIWQHIANHKQRSKLLSSQGICFRDHTLRLNRAGYPACSILLRAENRSRPRWRPLSLTLRTACRFRALSSAPISDSLESDNRPKRSSF